MSVLDLQGLTPEMETGGGGGGSTVTALTCNSGKPSNVSLALCH
jgi:hypothetical protein